MLIHEYDGVTITTSVQLRDERGFQSKAELGEPAIVQVVVEDPGAVYDFLPYKEWRISEDDCAEPIVWRGYVSNQSIGRMAGDLRNAPVGAARAWTLDLIEDNGNLDRLILTDPSSNRPSETVGERLNWLFTQPGFTGIIFDLGLVATFTDQMDPEDYTTRPGAEVLRDCSLVSGANFFVRVDQYSGVLELAFYDAITSPLDTSDLRISNVRSDIDADTWHPGKTGLLRRGASRIASGVLVHYTNGTYYENDVTTETTFGAVDQISPTPAIETKTAAVALAQRLLVQHSVQDERVSCRIQLPSANLNDIRHGQLMQARFVHLPGWEAFRYCRAAVKTFSRPEKLTQRVYDVDLELVPADPATPIGIRQFAAGRTATQFDLDITFAQPTVAGDLLLAWISRRTDPIGLQASWTNLSSMVEGLNAGGPGFTDYGQWQYRFADGSTTYTFGRSTGYSNTNISVWELTGANDFVPGDATLYETTGAGPLATQSLGSVTAPVATQTILAGWVQSTGLSGENPAAMGAGMVKDYNEGWSDQFADQHPWHLAAHWDGTTTPLTVSCTIPDTCKYGGVVVQL